MRKYNFQSGRVEVENKVKKYKERLIHGLRRRIYAKLMAKKIIGKRVTVYGSAIPTENGYFSGIVERLTKTGIFIEDTDRQYNCSSCGIPFEGIENIWV